MNVFQALKRPITKIKKKTCRCGATMDIFQREARIITWRCQACHSCTVDKIVKKPTKVVLEPLQISREAES